VTLDLHVAVALFLSCWRHCTDAMLRCTVGSTGAEDLASARLTSSLDNSTLNAPMPLSDPSVKLVLLSFSHLAQYARPITPMQWRRFFRQPSDVPMVGHRLNRCSWICNFSSNMSRRSFGYFKYLLSLDFHYAWAPLRRIGLDTLMVDWTWRLDDGLNISSWQLFGHFELYPWDLRTPTSVISQTC